MLQFFSGLKQKFENKLCHCSLLRKFNAERSFGIDRLNYLPDRRYEPKETKAYEIIIVATGILEKHNRAISKASGYANKRFSKG